jgi:VWFA-related protein
MRSLAVVLVVTLLPALEASSAEPKGRIAVFSAGVEVVKVTVSVEDQARHNVKDLAVEDFVLREDNRPQKIQVFGRAFDPGEDENLALDLAILFDTSESMITVLKLSQQAATRFLESIPHARDLLVVFFDQDLRISRYQSERQQGLFNQILSTESGGNTALRDAIAACLSRLSGSRGRHAMVLFTDGEDTFSRIGPEALTRLVRSSSVLIYPIALPGQARNKDSAMQARAFLDQLAELTGGRVFTPSGAGDLPGVYQTILNDLEGQYVIGYVPANTAQDGKYRKIKIEVNRKGVRIRHREGYYAPKASR